MICFVDLFWVGIAETIRLALLIEAREVRPLSEEVGVSPLQILERLLQRMHGRIGQPCGFRAIAPLGDVLLFTYPYELHLIGPSDH